MNIPTVTVEQMREIDRLMPDEFNIGLLQMMENAGRLIANAAQDIFRPKTATVLVGPGNNGADGLVAARYLHNKGVDVEVVLSLDPGDLSDVGAQHLDTLKILGIPVKQSIGKRPDLFIDCLLGYSTSGAPYGRVAEIMGEATVLETPVLSCDVPSGFELSTGQWHKPAFEGAVCITLGMPKKGMANNPGIKKLLVGDLGIPPEAYKSIGIDVPNLFLDKDYIIVSEREEDTAESTDKPEENAAEENPAPETSVMDAAESQQSMPETSREGSQSYDTDRDDPPFVDIN
ncbi:NAD(P)H-hydrate epimerase [Candidatus Woesearchaeota archaeon]|nr:NAD(P)H-hydrate epimerase [Candidatus Woesearchaeota archaeon]